MIPSPVNGHLGYFQFCVIIDRAAMIILIHVSETHVQEYLSGVHLGVELPPQSSC